MKIAYGVCSIGLGHASRSIPILKELSAEGHEITIFSYGRALELLKKEIPANYIEMKDYPLEFTDNPELFFINVVADSPLIMYSLFKEHELFLKYHAKNSYDMVISDNRYGLFARDRPSYLITHQLRIMNPYRLRILETGSMLYNQFFTNRFRYIMVPDMEEKSLSGNLSHNLKLINSRKIKYLGPFSDISKKNVEKDIDVMISISGPEPQRSIFEKIIMAQVKDLNMNYFISLGKPEEKPGNDRIRSYLSFEERESMFNRAKIFITRSGYSTIMDLYMIEGKALFVPTPKQPEQEYLAQYLAEQKLFYSVPQNSLDLERDLKIAEKYEGFKNIKYDAQSSVKKFMETVFGD